VEKLGVAVVGLDHWYAAHDLIRQIGKSPALRLAAVADEDAGHLDWTVRHVGGENPTTTLAAAIERPDVQIVATLASTDRNPELVRHAAALGKHIVSVKPMARTLAEADAVVAAVHAAGVHFFPLECLGRLQPDRLRYKQWIDEGRIGTPLRYTHTLNGSLPMPWPGEEGPSWWLDPSRVPGGAWLDHAIYEVDAARWLFGSELASVRGVASNIRHSELKVEDYGAATYTLASGAVALIEDTWTADRGNGFSRREIIGTAGTICEDTSAWGKVAVRGSFGFDGWVALQQAGGSSNPVEHIAAVARGEAAPVATVEDGRTNLTACLAFYEAARGGAVVAL
jgi:predicted dehydrogenase